MNNAEETIIKLDKVSKVYKLAIGNKGEFSAINDLSVEVKKGEKIGLMGDNGAGKTTLLKLIAGVTQPTKGIITVKGNVVSLINLGAGFNDELSGRDNIVLNGMIYGLTKQEVLKVSNSIIEFADIGKFIDAPYYVYSSGMRFRLALSVALATKPEIILMDEVFMAGDIDFQIKTLKKIEEITKDKKVTLIMASHYPLILRKYCNKFMFLKEGKLIDSSIESILSLTKKWNEYFSDIPKIGIEEEMSGDLYYQR